MATPTQHLCDSPLHLFLSFPLATLRLPLASPVLSFCSHLLILESPLFLGDLSPGSLLLLQHTTPDIILRDFSLHKCNPSHTLSLWLYPSSAMHSWAHSPDLFCTTCNSSFNYIHLTLQLQPLSFQFLFNTTNSKITKPHYRLNLLILLSLLPHVWSSTVTKTLQLSHPGLALQNWPPNKLNQFYLLHTCSPKLDLNRKNNWPQVGS